MKNLLLLNEFKSGSAKLATKPYDILSLQKQQVAFGTLQNTVSANKDLCVLKEFGIRMNYSQLYTKLNQYLMKKAVFKTRLFAMTFVIAVLFFARESYGQKSETLTNTSASTYTAPTGVSGVTVKLWGGGGGGGIGIPYEGGGGGGGAFQRSHVSLTGGTANYAVGAGGAGAAEGSRGTAGGSTSFTNAISAQGGWGGGTGDDNTDIGIGGAGGIGMYNGGNGSDPTSENSTGGGGGGAGDAGPGETATKTSVGGIGGIGNPSRGGNGGNGGHDDYTLYSSGDNGQITGGGGGGGAYLKSGGSGANGQIIVLCYTLTSTKNSGLVSSGSDVVITLAGTQTTLPVGTYTVTYDQGSADTYSATMVVTTAGTGTFTITGLTATTTINITGLSTSLPDITTTYVSGTSGYTTTVTVEESTSAPIAGNNGPVCAGSTLSLTASVVSGATYSWTGPNGFTSTAQNPTVSASATAAMGGEYSVTATIGSSTSPADKTTVVVNAIPSTPTAGNNGPVCAGSTLSLTASAVSGATYSWAGPNGFTSTDQNPTVSASATAAMGGEYSVTATIGSCTSPVGKTTVVVNAIPSTPTAGNNGPVCAGSTLSLTASAVSGATYSWAGPNGFTSTDQNSTVSASATAAMGGEYSVTATIGSCTSPAGKTTVVVNALPVVSAGSSVCVGSTIALSPITGGTWTSSNTAVAQVTDAGVVTGVSAGSATFTFTSTTTGCSKTTSSVTVNASPTITGTLAVCVGSTTKLTGSGTAASSSPWVSGTKTVATVSCSGLVTGVAAGTTIITYKNSAGYTTSATVTVISTPTITGALNVCAGSTTQLIGSGTATAINPWVSATKNVATISSIGLVTGVAAGTGVITYTSSTGCTQTAIVTVTVALAAPASKAACSITTTGFTTNWSASRGATGYYLDVSISCTFTSFVSGYNNKSVGSVVTSAVTGLIANTTYYYRVRAFNAVGTSVNSSIITVKTAPAAPIAIAATTIAKTSFSAKWNAFTGATSYYLDVSTVNTFASFVPGYNNKKVGNVVTYCVTGLTASTNYYYRIRAINSGGTSGNSNTITVTSLKSATVLTDSLQASVNTPVQTFDLPAQKDELNVYPNPSSGSATFEFRLSENARVKLDIYTLNGQLVSRIFDGDVEAGIVRTAHFEQYLRTGLYPCVLHYNRKKLTLKFLVKN